MVINLGAQTYQQTLPPPPQPQALNPNPNLKSGVFRPDLPDVEHVDIGGVVQEQNGSKYHLQGSAWVETNDLLLRADTIDFDKDTGNLTAKGNVYFESFVRGEKIHCDHLEYNTEDETGNFYEVSGTAQSQIHAKPGVLTTANPFYFESRWVERLQDRYILHNGFITDCKVPRPWWILRAPKFDVVMNEHAVAYKAWFRLRGIPIFYSPYFYKSLSRHPRHSGVLIPEPGNSSLRGTYISAGYYWAINRSMDAIYNLQYFTGGDIAHTAEFRGKLNSRTDFDLNIFGVDDVQGANGVHSSGVQINLLAKADLGDGWQARGQIDYLSSFLFRQQFTQSFNEAVSSETRSIGVLTKHWDDFGFNIVAERDVNFQSTAPGNLVEIRKLPEAQLDEREHEIKDWPVWFSFDSSAGLESRDEPVYETRQFVPRLDFEPQVTTAFHWEGFSLVPTFGLTEAFYGSSLEPGNVVSGQNLLENSRNVSIDLIFPSLARIFNAPKWMGAKVKHVIEPRVTYKYSTGINNYNEIIRFDENDLVSNTNEVDFSLTNRLLAKDKNGTVTDLLSWQLLYARFLDPTFGGAITPGERNVLLSEIDLTGYAFLDGYRHDSPIMSTLRFQPSHVGFSWQTDYDAELRRVTNSGLTIDGRWTKYFASIGDYEVRTDPALFPTSTVANGPITGRSNQIRWVLGYGNYNRRGWNAGLSMYYDVLAGTLQYWQAQVTYNTDCCGLSTQYGRFNFGTRDESVFRISFAVSNLGSFGTLNRQQRIF